MKKWGLRIISWLLIGGLLCWGILMIAIFACEKMDRPVERADVVIVLGARVMGDGTLSDTLKNRIETAYGVYERGLAGAFIVCGAKAGDEPVTEARAMADYLQGRGVPEEDVLLEDQSYSTVQNLANARELMRAHGFEKAILVTSDYHLSRGLWLCRDAGIEATGVPAPGPFYWHNRMKARAREALSWVNYFFGGRLAKMIGR